MGRNACPLCGSQQPRLHQRVEATMQSGAWLRVHAAGTVRACEHACTCTYACAQALAAPSISWCSPPLPPGASTTPCSSGKWSFREGIA